MWLLKISDEISAVSSPQDKNCLSFGGEKVLQIRTILKMLTKQLLFIAFQSKLEVNMRKQAQTKKESGI